MAGPADTARIGEAVAAVVARVFATVSEVHPAALAVLGGDEGPGLEGRVRELLGTPGQLAVGLGLIVAPRPENDLRLRLHWWQVEPAAERLVALQPDLRPSSLGFYDYTATDWFDVPRRTGRRHVVGPYVDVHGTGRYLLTFTEPVTRDGEFLGVVGADVPVGRFESRILHDPGRDETPFVLLNDEGRVVLSTSPHRLVGGLVAPGEPAGAGVPVAGVPWRLYADESAGRLLPA